MQSITTLFDFETTVEVLCALAARAIELSQGIIPGRINQDLLKNLSVVVYNIPLVLDSFLKWARFQGKKREVVFFQASLEKSAEPSR